MRRLDGDQIDELSLLYRRASSDLAMIRATMPDPDLIHQLSNDLARARSRLTGTSGASLVGMARWFKVTLPAALYEVRWWTIAIMALFLTITITEIVWLGRNPAAIETLMEPEAARSSSSTTSWSTTHKTRTPSLAHPYGLTTHLSPSR